MTDALGVGVLGATEESNGLGSLSETTKVALGFVCVIIGGVMSGTYSLPMRFVRTWKWENLWLIYCSLGGMLFPLIFCVASAPAGLEEYLTAESVLPVIGFGILWGFASVLFGLAIPLVGQSLTFGIVLSMSSAVGSLLPMLIFHTDKSFAASGLFVWGGLVVAVFGVVVLSIAGSRKEKEQNEHKANNASEEQRNNDETDSDDEVIVDVNEPETNKDDEKHDNDTDGESKDKKNFELESPSRETSKNAVTISGSDDNNSFSHSKNSLLRNNSMNAETASQKQEEKGFCGLSRASRGIICCIVSGLFSPMLNLGFTFGDSIRIGAENLGASPLVSSSTVWILAIGAGFVFNGGYPILLLCRNHTWVLFRNISIRDTLFNCLLMVIMGVLWFGGTVIYGMGATLIGSLGASIGWPVFMALMVLSANIGAIIQGEWRNTSARPRCLLAIGLIVLIVSIVFFALSSVYDTDESSSLLSSSISS